MVTKKDRRIRLFFAFGSLLTLLHYSFLPATNLEGNPGEKTSFVSELVMNDTVNELPKDETWITVFVHGIMSIKPHLSTDNFFRLLRDDVDNSLYAKTVEYMRDDPVFYKNQAMQMPGLHPVYPHDIKRGNASGALAYTLNAMENHYDIAPLNSYYYTFGWSGLLSSKKRFEDAQRLFEELEKLVADFRKQGIEPKLRLYGYSHGGNVLLNLAEVRRQVYPNANLKITELSLWGTPIQYETDHLINDPLFEKILHHYSEKDRVQWADFFSSGTGGFSSQKFKTRRGFELPDKLTQIKLKIVRPARAVQNNAKKFALSGNFNNRSIILGRSHLLRDISPGHVELWFFPWTPQYYRESYPLYPFPTVSYSSVIDHYVKQVKNNKPHEVITADLRPDYGVLMVRKEASPEIYTMLQLPSKEQWKKMKADLYKYAPKKYTTSLYNKHTKIAYYKAQESRTLNQPPRIPYRKRRRVMTNNAPQQPIMVAQNP